MDALHHRTPTRVALIYGTVKPRFCGVESCTAITHSVLVARGMEVVPVSLADWRVSRTAELHRLVSDVKPDVILIAYPTLAIDRKLAPILFGLLQRIAPLVAVIHEYNHVHILRRMAISALVLRASHVVVTTEEERAGLTRWNRWLRPRVTVSPIPSTIPLREWRPSAAKEVTIFSQFRPDKGLETFLACCGELAEARPDLAFRIIGSEVPRLRGYADEIRQEAAARGVVVTEDLTDDAVADVLSTATVALLPYPDGATYRRGSLIAAAVCGVPIVTTAGRNTPADLLRLLSPVQTQAEMVRRTLEYCDDPQARAVAHQRSMEMSETFSTDAVVGNLARLLEAVAHRAGGTPATRFVARQA